MKIKITATQSNRVTVGENYEVHDVLGDLLFITGDDGKDFSFIANDFVEFQEVIILPS